MADYIDRERIFSIWRSMPAPASVTSLAAAISQTPAADADVVEVVRCRDCVLHGNCLTEDIFRIARIDNPYCCGGKKMEEQDGGIHKEK